MNIFDSLAAPFDPDLISWRAQNVTNDGTKALALCYIDARDVMKRLDEVLTPAGWEDSYIETVKGRVLCTIRIDVGTRWIEKSDGAGDTDVEGEKGGISDAFKRAAVKWGIGRYLYDVEPVWAPCEAMTDRDGKLILNNRQKPQWKAWKREAQAEFDRALAKAAKPLTGTITDTTYDWLTGQMTAVGCEPAEILKFLTPANIKSLTYEQLPAVREFLKSKRKVA